MSDDTDRKLRLEREIEEAEREEAEEERSYNPGENRLRAVLLLFGELWRLIRGEDGRGRKVRWLLGAVAPLPDAGAGDVRGADRRHRRGAGSTAARSARPSTP